MCEKQSVLKSTGAVVYKAYAGNMWTNKEILSRKLVLPQLLTAQ